MKMINKLIVPVTASALLLGACGASATDSKENTLISSKARRCNSCRYNEKNR